MRKLKFYTAIVLLLFIFSRSAFAFLPDDPFYIEQWNLAWTRASQAWDLNQGSEEVIVAILDSGVDIDHPDLKNNIWKNPDEIPNDKIDNDKNGYVDDINGWDFINNIPDPRSKFASPYSLAGINHGTLVAGIAAASGNNGLGIAGVAWKIKIMPLRVLNSQGTGDTLSVIKAIDYAIKKKANVINMSFVGQEYAKELEEAITRAWKAGIVIVAAAGNDSVREGVDLEKFPAYPICYGEKENMVIGVAALDKNNKKALFSNYGKCVDISAPGTGIYSTLVYHPEDKDFNKYYGGYWSGTSLAAPLVSGTAALIKSINPQLSNTKIRDIILNEASGIDSANPELAGKLGQGILDIYSAARKAYLDLTTFSSARNIVTGAGLGGGPQIRIFKSNGFEKGNFFAYDKNFRGGVNVAVGDINGDGKDEIITGAGQGGGPQVRIFSLAEGSGKAGVAHQPLLVGGALPILQFFAYDKNFRGGVNVAVGDINGDGKDEIITGAGQGGGPQVRIFDDQGRIRGQFFAYDERFRGGVNVAIGDLNGDGKDEIITGAGSGGGPQVRVFSLAEGSGKAERSGALPILQFFAYDKNFRGGVNMAVGDLNGDGKDEIITGAGAGGGPQVRVFEWSGKARVAHQPLLVGGALPILQFFAYDKNFRGGVNVAVGDLNNDGKTEIITGPGFGGGPQVRIFDNQGHSQSQFFAYNKNFQGGIAVATIRN